MTEFKFRNYGNGTTFRRVAYLEGYGIGDELGSIVYSTDVERERYQGICNGTKLMKIVRVETNELYCGCGVATALIQSILKDYSEWNIYLLCKPMPRGNCDETHKTVKDLRRFYSKFGFVPCGELLPTMIKKASLPTLGEK